MKPVIEAVKSPRVRQKPEQPAVLGRSASKDPAREAARLEAHAKDLKPTRSPGSSRDLEQGREQSGSDQSGSDQSGSDQSGGEQPVKRKPSRASRSMKSRQSEPRASRSGGKVKAQAKKGKPPIVLMVVAGILIVIGLILLPRSYQASPRASTQVRYDVPGAVAAKLETKSRQATPNVVGDVRSVMARGRQRMAMNLTAPKDIQLEQIVGFQSGIPDVILFRDGSKLPADPVTLEQLPADVRLQLTYTRERQ